MPPASNRLQHPAYHDLDVAVVAPIVLVTTSPSLGLSFQD
jgi:hypothetical protein